MTPPLITTTPATRPNADLWNNREQLGDPTRPNHGWCTFTFTPRRPQ